MAKLPPLPCSPENCGNACRLCGTVGTYNKYKCRCDPCRAAKAESAKRDRAKNAAVISERNRRWRAENADWLREYELARRDVAEVRERRRQYMRDWNEKNSEKMRQYRADRYLANRERVIELACQWAADNREQVRANWRKRYRDCPEFRERCRASRKKWAQRNPDKIREYGRRGVARRRVLKLDAVTVPYTPEQLAQRMAYYGNKCYLKLEGCAVVGTDIEHVKPLSKGGSEMLCNLRPACRPCNSRKHAKWPFVA